MTDLLAIGAAWVLCAIVAIGYVIWAHRFYSKFRREAAHWRSIAKQHAERHATLERAHLALIDRAYLRDSKGRIAKARDVLRNA